MLYSFKLFNHKLKNKRKKEKKQEQFTFLCSVLGRKQHCQIPECFCIVCVYISSVYLFTKSFGVLVPF